LACLFAAPFKYSVEHSRDSTEAGGGSVGFFQCNYAPRTDLLLRSAEAPNGTAYAAQAVTRLVELRPSAGDVAVRALVRLAIIQVQFPQLLCDRRVELGQLPAYEVECADRLIQRDEVLGGRVTCKLGNLVDVSVNPNVPHGVRRLGVALAGNGGAQDLLARLARHFGDYSGQPRGHLRQRSLHVLNQQTPIQALKAERKSGDDLFAKNVYEHAGRENLGTAKRKARKKTNRTK